MISDPATGDGIEGVFEFNALPNIQRQAQAFADMHRFLIDLGLCREDQEPYQVVDMAKALVSGNSDLITEGLNRVLGDAKKDSGKQDQAQKPSGFKLKSVSAYKSLSQYHSGTSGLARSLRSIYDSCFKKARKGW